MTERALDAQMEDRAEALLPDGLRDVLPQQAAQERLVVSSFMDIFESHGYDHVEPPMVEFEESLLRGAGAATAAQTFRLMDPVSQRMMGVRADMTVQVARIAMTRLSKSPRPLRLCYAGHVLRVRGGQLRPERQVTQAGCELIGPDVPAADAEVIALAAEAAAAVGVRDVSVDISLPTLVPAICERLVDSGDLTTAQVGFARAALDRKDAAEVESLGGAAAALLGGLLKASGPAAEALEKLDGLTLEPREAAERDRLRTVLADLAERAPELRVTVDPAEHRGFEYQTGISFTLFAGGVRGELGRGGRYRADGEAGTGFSLYLDTVMRSLPTASLEEKVFLPFGTATTVAEALREAGWSVVRGLEAVENVSIEAQRLGCVWLGGFDDNDPIAMKKAAQD